MKKRISVAMAVYNGEKYLVEQIDSIITQLKESDEVIISYNPSNDKSLDILLEYEKRYKNIQVIYCDKKGVFSNFENAIIHCTGDIIFLADQDDVWNEDKIEIVLNAFAEYGVNAVAHKSVPVDENLKCLDQYRSRRKQQYVSPFKILIQNYVQGCCLAFDANYKKLILPFPEKIPMHDSWIALIMSSFGKMIFLDAELQIYRQHDGNVTSRKHQGVLKMIVDRFNLTHEFLKRAWIIKEIEK